MDSQQDAALIQEAITRAEAWQNRANQLLTVEEKGIQEQMYRLLTHPLDKVVLTKLIDQSFRSHDNDRIADQVNSILRQYGVPDFFSRVEKLLIQMFLGVGHHFPALSVPTMIERMRQSSSRAVIAGEEALLRLHLRKRKQQGVRMNVNHLGEAVLGEKECRRRLEIYRKDLQNPDIECLSVKISTIYSQINSLAFDHTVQVLRERLSDLYHEAEAYRFIRADGTCVPKFINLDMEEYRDMDLTYHAFIDTLSRKKFKHHSAGIALQAYLPDAHQYQKELTKWARHRVTSGGAPVKLRIIKGANMEMEQLESVLHNWPLAPYDNKLDVDANYKRMVCFGMKPENIQAVNLGVASHNLFDLAYAASLAEHFCVTKYFYFEMLEGMADHIRRAIHESRGDVLLYAPVATKADFINAIAYLIRRLDENTAPENFLRYAPKLEVGSPEWELLRQRFVESCAIRDTLGLGPHRFQNRNEEKFNEKTGSFIENEFRNEPDTDWSLKANRIWAEAVRNQWKKESGHIPCTIPLAVGGQELFHGREILEIRDPSLNDATILLAHSAMATSEDVDQAVDVARADPDGWRKTSHRKRYAILSKAAMELRRSRGELIGAAAANTGKVFFEADSEVSEAVDFTEFYPYTVHAFANLDNIVCRGKGVVVVISPWNFPIAIPCGGIVAALSSGNTVILKPSSDSILVAWTLCQCFWRAGISKNTLQFLPCAGSTVGSRLTCQSDVDAIILTGGTETGMKILKQHPGVYLAAETGGKNATIVTAMADRDQAVKNVLYSAFGNCGQKCSATSLLILEKEVYEDMRFKEQLVDAAESFPVGSAWDFHNRMGPLIRPLNAALKHAMTRLEPKESWALKPKNLMDNPCLWSPGIKWGVQPQSDTHMTEFFGPILGVMRAENLDHAISLVNQTGYGLTSGLESLDPREQSVWKERIIAGNLYINRGTTGAVTLRQPFGGMGKSALGPGIKAGGLDYVSQFMRFKETGFPSVGIIEKDNALLQLAQRWQRKIDSRHMSEHRHDIVKVVRAIKSYLYHWEQHFSRVADYFHLRGQDNLFRYVPVGKIVVRIHPEDTLFDVLARIAAALISKNITVLSIPHDLQNAVVCFLVSREGTAILHNVELVYQNDLELIESISIVHRIRYAAPGRVPRAVFAAAAESGFFISRATVLMEGRIELLHYCRQQSICNNYHRYGNIGERSMVSNQDTRGDRHP